MRSSLVLSLLLGCGQDICIRHSDCVAGEVCGVNGVCGLMVEDAGETDAAPPDAAEDAVDVSSDAITDAATDAMADAPTDGGP